MTVPSYSTFVETIKETETAVVENDTTNSRTILWNVREFSQNTLQPLEEELCT